MPHRVREPAGDTLEVGENPVTPLLMQAIEGGTEELTVIHRKDLKREPGRSGLGLFRAFLRLMSSGNRRIDSDQAGLERPPKAFCRALHFRSGR
jgi:hypothetical protein